MTKIQTRFFLAFCTILFVFSSFNLKVNALSIKQNDVLLNRIAKDFSNKFCNGVGFGLSQESALSFAMKENMAIFKKKKGIENINTKDIAEKVSISVVDKCGYPLNLSEDELGETFKKG
tara:strand:- start:274 stop:630 length:357 start_codon:yes stop_codon:yes gene_type:complete